MGMEQRGPERGHEAEQLLDIGVLGAPERQRIEPGSSQKCTRIDAAAMRGVEDEWPLQRFRARHRERRNKLPFNSLSLARLMASPCPAGGTSPPARIACKLCQ